ncbi:hypothetical protein E4T50_12655 [Aureobasidium sp. EXF-12298]|nr:hypothetical protein E4T50_12655 [Aureobasidium sp. EXF-12298]
MAQRIPVPPANAYSHHAMPSDFLCTPDDFLIDIVEGSDSVYNAPLNRQIDTKHRKKQSAPILATFHCWKLTKAAPKTKDGALSWKRAAVVQTTLPSDELESQVKKQLKAKSLIDMYEALSTDQRQQVEVLIQQQRRDETNKHARWEIAAIHREVLNNLRTRIRETTFIRIIWSRDDRRKVEKARPGHETTSASVASNISDLNDLSNSLLEQTNTKRDQGLPPPRREFKGQARARKPIGENVIEVMPDLSIGDTHVISVPSMASPLPSARLQGPSPTWNNQAPLWQSPSTNIEHENMLRNRLDQQRPLPGSEVQNDQHHVQNALAYMANVNSNVRTQAGGRVFEEPQGQSALHEPWFSQQSPPIVPDFRCDSHTMPIERQFEGSTTQRTPPHLGLQSTNCEQDYFGKQSRNPYEEAVEPSMARQYHHANNNAPVLAASHRATDSEANRASPITKIQAPTDSEWPDYNPEMEPSPLPSPQSQQQTRHAKRSAERLRREDVLFWRTQAQLSCSRSSSSLDDQSSTLASLEESSPPTSVSGDGVAPQFQYHEGDAHAPGRFGQQLAAHSFLRPNQDRQQEQPLKMPQRSQTDYKLQTRRTVSFDDEPYGIHDRQHAPQPVPNARGSSMYTPDNYTRPSAPEPPEPKANYSFYQPQRYQPQQTWELDNTSMLERLNERLDHMELRQAEGATRRAVEAAQKRRELEKKEAYERGIEDAMAWKARPGGVGSFN